MVIGLSEYPDKSHDFRKFIFMTSDFGTLLNLGRTKIYRRYNWIEYDVKGMYWGLEKPLLVNILQMEGRYQLKLVGFYKTLIIGTKVCLAQEGTDQAVLTWE